MNKIQKITPDDISFSKGYELKVLLPYNGVRILVSIPNTMEAFDEVLAQGYKNKISDFINSGDQWHDKCVEAIKVYGKESYNYDSGPNDVIIYKMHILFEQGDLELYGLAFWTAFDIENSGGLKINKKYEILQIGDYKSSI